MQRYVYLFKEGSSAMKSILGLKGSRLCEIYRMGFPTPPGLVITTEGCAKYYENNRSHPQGLEKELSQRFEMLERGIGRKLGHERDPLLVSVRAGAEKQMPGLMDSCCNIGLNDKSVIGLARRTSNETFAWDTYRRFIEDFGSVSMGIQRERFENARDALLQSKKLEEDANLTTQDIRQLIEDYLKIVNKYAGKPFPQNPEEQLWMTIEAIFKSWNYQRSIAYRRTNDMLDLRGTGVTIQAMVFGNLNNQSGAGRVFSRNPLTGEKGLYGRYLMNIQGEEMMSGRALAPKDITKLKIEHAGIYAQLSKYGDRLEEHFHDVQDMQFTIQDGKLFILYSKDAKRTPTAALKIATDLVKEGKTRVNKAVMSLAPSSFQYLRYKTISSESRALLVPNLIGTGTPGSLAAASGVVVFNKEKVEHWAREKGKKVILISKDCSSEDYVPVTMVDGYITQRGGVTADFAILARDIGKACVFSVNKLQIHSDLQSGQIGDFKLKEGDVISINGATGEIYKGEVGLKESEIPADYFNVMNWVDTFCKLKMMVNANTAEEAKLGRRLGAEGIGLLRTENSISVGEKLKTIQKAIFAVNPDEKTEHLKKLAHSHKEDIQKILLEMDGKPCVIRMLDSSLNDYIPSDEGKQKSLSKELNIPLESIKAQHKKYAEFYPSLGMRGTRLSVIHPYIYTYQAKAIFMAAMELADQGKHPVVLIELPMVSSSYEYTYAKKIIDEAAKEVGADHKVNYKVGLLVEVPRAALTIHEVAHEIGFIHFGTNDLTQMTCGFSREDSGRFLNKFVEKGIYSKGPFDSVDQKGVGEFMKICIERVKKVNPGIQFGVAGKHACDLPSIEFFSKMGINNLSCPPSFFPVAKISAAQVSLMNS